MTFSPHSASKFSQQISASNSVKNNKPTTPSSRIDVTLPHPTIFPQKLHRPTAPHTPFALVPPSIPPTPPTLVSLFVYHKTKPPPTFRKKKSKTTSYFFSPHKNKKNKKK